MKKINLLLVFTFTLPLFLSAQGKLAKITNERWNEAENRWQFIQAETWDYDQNQTGREILFTHRDSIISVYTPQNYRRIESIYDDEGHLIEQKIQSWGDTETQEIQINYTFDAQNQLVEKLTKQTHSDSENIHYTKEIYERDDVENRRSYINFQAINTPDNFIADHRRDSFFSANGCLLKQTILNYDEMGELINERWWTSTFAEGDDCRLLTEGYWGRYENGSDSMILYSRHTFDYTNNNRMVSDVYERYKKSIDLWTTQHLLEKEYDEEGRIIRYFWEQYKWSFTDTLLKIYTYTPLGEIDTYQEFKTSYFHSDEPLRLIKSDHHDYTYDNEGNLILKHQFTQNYNHPVREITTNYEYYCNNQLKRETTSEIGQYKHRKTYEYHGNADCELEPMNKPKIQISPNPSTGTLVLTSNLLATEDALVQVFDMVGREVYRKKINRVSERLVLSLSDLASGQYVLVVQNNSEVISEVFLIF